MHSSRVIFGCWRNGLRFAGGLFGGSGISIASGSVCWGWIVDFSVCSELVFQYFLCW